MSDGFGGGSYDHMLGQGAAGYTPDKVNTHGYQQQESENGLSKKKRNKVRSSANTGPQMPTSVKSIDKTTGFLPKNGRKSNGQLQHNNNNNNNHTGRSSQSEYEVLCEKDDLDNRTVTEFNGLHSPRSGGATASWNGKQDNTKAVPDPSSIVERLIHLRDCIKQVTSVMQSLEKTDEPVKGKQMNSLNQMLQMLRTEEQENLELLQQVLASREESEKASAPNSVQRDLSPIQASTSSTRRRNNPPPQDPNDNDNDDSQNDLLLRMVESQNKFASIQEQQASLLRLQEQAEKKLAAARALHEHMIQSSLAVDWGVTGSVSSNLSTSSVSSNSSSSNGSGGGEGRQSHSNPLLIHEVEVSEDDVNGGPLVQHENNSDDTDDDMPMGNRPPVVPPRKEESPAYDLEDIKKRISALRELQLDRQVQCDQAEETGLVSSSTRSLGPDVLSREAAHRATDRQRQQLEGKLRQLQEKKQQMDSLLAELSTLHTCGQPTSDDQLDIPSSVSPASFASPISSASHKMKVASDIGETQRKLKQLEEMKNTLKTLQRLTENIEQVDNSINKEDMAPPPPPTRGRSQTRQDSAISISSLKPDNLRAASSAQFPARRHYEAEGRANEDADMQNVAPPMGQQHTAGLVTLAGSANGNVGSGNGISRSTSGASDCRSIDQKVKKLADAQSKLRQLKQLLNAMQQQQQRVCQDGEEQADVLLSSLQQTEFSTPINENSTGSPVDNHEDLGEESEDSGVSADQGKISQADFDTVLETAKSQRQLKRELEALLQERRHLQTIQDLSSLQLHMRNLSGSQTALGPSTSSTDSLNNSRDRSSGEGGSLFRTRAASQLPSSFTSNEMGRQDNLHRENGGVRGEAPKTLNSQANNSSLQQGKGRSRSRSSASPSQVNHNNNNVCQNGGNLSELSNQLTYNLALRDELRAQKAVLQELLKQERSKQMGFLQNQDTQSHSESTGKTEKSEVSIQCPSSMVASPLDSHDVTAVAHHWGMLGHGSEKAASYSASENLQGFDEPQPQQQSGLSSPWQKNFSSASPGQEDMSPFQQTAHVQNFSRRMAPPRLPPPPPPLPQQPVVQEAWSQGHQSQWEQLSRHFQKQAESSHALCQALLREQQLMVMNPTSASSSTASSNGLCSNVAGPSELLSSYVQQLQQQQQLLFSLGNCFHLLCLQQLQVTQIHAAWAIQQGSAGPSHQELAPSPFSYQAISEPLTSTGYSFSSQWPTSGSSKPSSTAQSMPYFAPQPVGLPPSASPFGYQPMSSSAYNIISGDDNTSVSSGNSLAGHGAPETLNNQVPPRSRTNNFLDNFRSNSRQNLLSSKCNEPQHQLKSKAATPGSSVAPPVGDPRSHLRSTFSLSSLTGEDITTAMPSPAPASRQNVSCDSGSHFGGVRPRTKKPNFSQEKINSLSGLSNVSATPVATPSTHQGHHPPVNRSRSLFSPVLGPYQFPDNPPKTVQAKDSPVVHPKPFAGSSDPGGCIQESIYKEVSQLLSQWEEQPTVLRDLLDQIRSFQAPQSLGPQSQRANLLDFSSISLDKPEEGSPTAACQSKLSKQGASFGSKCLKPHNASSQQQPEQRPSLTPVAPGCLPSSHRQTQHYSTEQLKNQETGHGIVQVPQRQGTSGMESIPESYTSSTIKSEKPDAAGCQLRGSGSNSVVAANLASEESCSLTSSASSPQSSSSTSHNSNGKGTAFNCSSHQQTEDFRAAPDGGVAMPPSPPLQTSPAPLLHSSVLPPLPSSSMVGGASGVAKLPEDCAGYLYDAEGETEAEMEDDDTKDLAEADQSAGQISLGHGLRDVTIDGSVRSGSSSLSLAAGGAAGGEGAEGGEDLCTLSTEIVSTGSSSTNPCCSCPLVPAANGTLDSNSCEHSCLSSSAQASAPDLDIDELALDDVPIKLETFSPEELLRRQIAEEQACNSLLAEMLTDTHGVVQLAPDVERGLTHSGAF